MKTEIKDYPILVEIIERTVTEYGDPVIMRNVTVGTKKHRVSIFETDSFGVAEAVERVAIDTINAVRITMTADITGNETEEKS